ncbi:hypothetical protein [Micromonospora sp. CB01531]|uniref:hypothetical protein n=1 Tax=Micromonospora sp. CB01531 TaxID=1718947 RepID=UPI000938C974|nr:hypothetical protein [Micromonospora sp. CB01531]OKI58183.1 hypothetical protein A6A27_30125 [Micromonospora sp. CB01531]
MTARPARHRRGPRIAVAILLLVLIAGLFGAQAVQLRHSVRADAATVSLEQQGVRYLRPAVRLVAELANARSAAVRSETPEAAALTAAISAMADADAASGDALRSRQRWSQLRAQVERLRSQAPTGRAALQEYGEALALALDLCRTVLHTAHLATDGDPYRNYLAYTAASRLPVVLAGAGFMADRWYLDGRGSGAVRERATLAVSVTRSEVAEAATAIGAGPGAASDVSASVGRDLFRPLDVFRDVAGQLAGPAVLEQEATPSDVATVTTDARTVQEAGRALAGATFNELDRELVARRDDLAAAELRQLLLALAGVAGGLVLLWWAVPARGRDLSDRPADTSEPPFAGDIASVAVALPEVDARDLLAIEELVHVGRGVRPRPRDEAGNAE